MSEDPRVVLDSSALLAYLYREAGDDMVEGVLARGGVMSAANQAEVLTRLVDDGVPLEETRRRLEEQGLFGGLLTVFPLTEEDAVQIVDLRAATREYGLSLGDRACLALARRLGLPAMTADRAWENVTLDIAIQQIRP